MVLMFSDFTSCELKKIVYFKTQVSLSLLHDKINFAEVFHLCMYIIYVVRFISLVYELVQHKNNKTFGIFEV